MTLPPDIGPIGRLPAEQVVKAARLVREASGAVIRDLPLTPERVWRALQPQAPQPQE